MAEIHELAHSVYCTNKDHIDYIHLGCVCRSDTCAGMYCSDKDTSLHSYGLSRQVKNNRVCCIFKELVFWHMTFLTFCGPIIQKLWL